MWKEGNMPLNQPNSDVHRFVGTVKCICGKCVRQKKTTTRPHTDVCGYVEKDYSYIMFPEKSSF